MPSLKLHTAAYTSAFPSTTSMQGSQLTFEPPPELLVVLIMLRPDSESSQFQT